MIKEIDFHCIEKDKYGFTLPYLYKIERDSSGEKSITDLLALFTTAEKKYVITYCSDLDEYVLGLPKKENAPIHMYNNFGNLHYDQDKLGNFDTFEQLAEFMAIEYQIRVDENTFSKNIESKIWE